MSVCYIYVRLVMSSYLFFCCIYFDAWCITCCPKREENLQVYTRVIAYICYTLMLGVLHAVEVLVLGLLVVVYEMPYSCIFNTASSCSCLCHIYSWFLPMSWILDLSILLSICRAYIYARLVMPSYLFFCI